MKLGIYFGKILVLLTVFIMSGCGSSAPAQTANQVSSGSAGMDLDAVIREAVGQMEARLPARTTLALVSVASPSAAFSEQVITRLESAIVGNRKLGVVDRANLDKIRSEQGFQLSGEVDDDSAKAIGKLLGAGAIVTGSLTDLGDVYSLTLKAINIETAMVVVSYLADLAKTTRIETLLASGGGAGSGRTATAQPVQAGNRSSGTTAQAPAAPATPAVPEPVYDVEYKVGGKGPAGGWIFYDKGRATNGWRYLEAAPSETEFTAAWGTRGETVGGTSTGIGAGKRNTEMLLKYLNEKGEIGGLAQVCSDLFIGGFDGWFLPSKDELDLIYKNLKVKRIGGFADSRYWSSSEVNERCAWLQMFDYNGQQEYDFLGSFNKNQSHSVRAVRQF
ncbi:MAG: hypothetical protein LBQ88_16245 [Treponema sp.]|jgi:hypothetical protein|nr:hypothetical protein [Treponema sp.]